MWSARPSMKSRLHYIPGSDLFFYVLINDFVVCADWLSSPLSVGILGFFLCFRSTVIRYCCDRHLFAAIFNPFIKFWTILFHSCFYTGQ